MVISPVTNSIGAYRCVLRRLEHARKIFSDMEGRAFLKGFSAALVARNSEVFLETGLAPSY